MNLQTGIKENIKMNKCYIPSQLLKYEINKSYLWSESLVRQVQMHTELR